MRLAVTAVRRMLLLSRKRMTEEHKIAVEIGVSVEQIARCPDCGIWFSKSPEEPKEMLCKQCDEMQRRKPD